MGIDCYVRRVAGGFGLIYTGGMVIDTSSEKFVPSVLNDPVTFVRTGRQINARLQLLGLSSQQYRAWLHG